MKKRYEDVSEGKECGGAQVRHRVGCVSFINSKPLIESLVEEGALARLGVRVEFAVPSELLPLVESGAVETALMSVVDFQMSKVPLVLVPAGAIGCDGHTLTVRIFSKVPPERILEVHGDTDSHTSVILAQVILRERYGVGAKVVPLRRGEGSGERGQKGEGAETVLLIGDKVVNAAPSEAEYPYQLDLGDEWKQMTGLPFVFAMWMMRADAIEKDAAGARELAGLLAWARVEGGKMTEVLLDRYCVEKRWPRDLARRYFTEFLKYEVTEGSREGLAKFFELAGKWKLLEVGRKIRYWEVGA